MSNGTGFMRTLVGLIIVVVISAGGAALWNGVFSEGIPLQGQWDPTAGPVGPVASEDYGLITVQEAYQRYQDEVINEFIRFIDARTPDHFEEGHIEGAINVPGVYDQDDDFLALWEQFREICPPETGLPVILYCSGADCTDSKELQDKMYADGYGEVLVMFEGYPAWKDAGYPVVEPDETFAIDEPLYPTSSLRWPTLAGMGLMLVLAFGAAASPGIRKLWTSTGLSLLFRLALGGIFFYAALHKIIEPGDFAKQVYGYKFLPGSLINLFAMFLPWLEAVAGLLLIVGCFTRGSALAIALMLLAFIIAISFNVVQGNSFDCGCFKAGEEGKVSDPIELLFRDIALLVMAIQVLAVGAYPGIASMLFDKKK